MKEVTLQSKVRDLRAQLDTVVSGYDEIKDMIIVCLLADGHVLLEAVPGTAKTTLVNTLRAAIEGCKSARIQMTPDLKPTDITGVEVFNQKKQDFVTRMGAIVSANLLLADEINRTTPKTLSALLEAMQERQVTIGDTTYTLQQLFIMLATQNPVENEGVFPVPEATLDRFLMKLTMKYVSRENEIAMLRNVASHGRKAQSKVQKVVSVEELLEMQLKVLELCSTATQPLLEYIVDLTRATRPGDDETADEIASFDAVHGADAKALREQIAFGASPRCEIATLHSAAAVAFINGDDHIEPAHVKRVFRNIARHRIILTDAAVHDGLTTDKVITKVLDRVKVVDTRASK
jgi:MoxR-like ATPase